MCICDADCDVTDARHRLASVPLGRGKGTTVHHGTFASLPRETVAPGEAHTVALASIGVLIGVEATLDYGGVLVRVRPNSVSLRHFRQQTRSHSRNSHSGSGCACPAVRVLAVCRARVCRRVCRA